MPLHNCNPRPCLGFGNQHLEFILPIGPDEHLDGTVVGPLHVLGEIAGGQLTRLPMVSHALAAKALPRTGLVGTVALRFVWLDFTLFHIRPLSLLGLLVCVRMMMG